MKRFCISYYPRPSTQSIINMQMDLARLKQENADIPIRAILINAQTHEDAMRVFIVDTIARGKQTGITREILNIEEW